MTAQRQVPQVLPEARIWVRLRGTLRQEGGRGACGGRVGIGIGRVLVGAAVVLLLVVLLGLVWR